MFCKASHSLHVHLYIKKSLWSKLQTELHRTAGRRMLNMYRKCLLWSLWHSLRWRQRCGCKKLEFLESARHLWDSVTESDIEMGWLDPWHWLVDRQETHSFWERGEGEKGNYRAGQRQHDTQRSASLTVTRRDDRLTGDVPWCVCSRYKGDFRYKDKRHSSSFFFSWGARNPSCQLNDMSSGCCSTTSFFLLHQGVRPLAFLLDLLLLLLVLSSVVPVRLPHGPLRPNATQAPDHVSASHEPPVSSSSPISSSSSFPPFPLLRADQAQSQNTDQ